MEAIISYRNGILTIEEETINLPSLADIEVHAKAHISTKDFKEHCWRTRSIPCPSIHPNAVIYYDCEEKFRKELFIEL